MKKLVAVLLSFMLCLAVPALAVQKKCPPNCKHRAEVCAKPQPVTQAAPASAVASNQVWDALVSGFSVNAGFRWETLRECPTIREPRPELAVKDPFYLGLGLSLPLSEQFSAHGAWDRDFTDEPRWQARTWVSFTPFK